jgi:hypothetical protein
MISRSSEWVITAEAVRKADEFQITADFFHVGRMDKMRIFEWIFHLCIFLAGRLRTMAATGWLLLAFLVVRPVFAIDLLE